MDPRHAILFEPVTIGPKTLPNRSCQVPHASGQQQATDSGRFRGIKAEGGWAASWHRRSSSRRWQRR